MTITIDLDTSRYPHAFDKAESFWDRPIEKMLSLLAEHRQLCPPRTTPSAEAWRAGPIRRPHLAITVLGERGSGKSSLLRTFEKRLENMPDIELLPQIDPTQLSRYDNFLHAFMALLLEKIEQMAQTRGQAVHELECRKPLQQLADHLWTANGSPPREDDDPVAASLERLDRHRSGPLLKRSLQDFLFAVARDLGKMRGDGSLSTVDRETFLVLPIDDPDMSFEHFASILDLYRRYLRHPQLIPIFAFSKKLGRELMTFHFGSHFGYEKKRIGDEVAFRAEVEELADQFLDKYLPPRSRIALELPQDVVLSAHLRRSRAAAENGSVLKQELGRADELLRRGAERLFGRQELAVPLLPSSLRRVLQLLDVLAAELGPSGPRADTEPVAGQDRERRSLGDLRFFETARSVLQVHQAALGRYGIDPETIFAAPIVERGPRLLEQVAEAAATDRGLIEWSGMRLPSLLGSLLAVAAFRPFEESGAESLEPPPPSTDGEPAADQNPDRAATPTSFDRRLTVRWLLRLLLGFYLPLRGPTTRSTTGENRGWGPGVTPRRLLLEPDAESFAGHLFVHAGGPLYITFGEDRARRFEIGSLIRPFEERAWRDYSCRRWLSVREDHLVRRGEEFDGLLDPFPGLSGLLSMLDADSRLMVSIWTLCGPHPRPWAVVSLWRGLDLLLRLLEHPSDLSGLIQEHARRAVTEQRPHAVAGTPSQTAGRLEPWGDIELKEASERLAGAVTRWLGENPSPPVERRWLIRSLHGLAIERDLLRPISAASSRMGAHRRGGGTLLLSWLEAVQSFLAETEQAPWLTTCPFIQPLLAPVKTLVKKRAKEEEQARKEQIEEAPAKKGWNPLWRLTVKRRTDADDLNTDPRIEIDHPLKPFEILDLLIPADSESYFARFARQLRDPDPAAMV